MSVCNRIFSDEFDHFWLCSIFEFVKDSKYLLHVWGTSKYKRVLSIIVSSGFWSFILKKKKLRSWVTWLVICRNLHSPCLGDIQELRGPIFVLFWPPTYLSWTFVLTRCCLMKKKLIFCQYFFFLWTRLFLKHTIDFLDFGPHGYYTDYLPTFRGQSWTFDWPPKYLLHLVHVVFELPPIHTSHGLIDRKGYYRKI